MNQRIFAFWCGKVLANFLSTPLAAGLGGDSAGWPYVAFDLDPGRVKVTKRVLYHLVSCI